MAAKTFVPQIVKILHRACNYIAKHHAKLAAVLSGPQLSALDAVVSACNAFTGLVSVPPEEP